MIRRKDWARRMIYGMVVIPFRLGQDYRNDIPIYLVLYLLKWDCGTVCKSVSEMKGVWEDQHPR